MSPPEHSPLSEDQIHEFAKRLYEWAESHPLRDVPLMGFLGGPLLTPRQMYAAVVERTEDGQNLLRMAQYSLEVISFERLMQMWMEGARL
jgi:predicted ATP-grasp superfamily ATP-dependent carboligase